MKKIISITSCILMVATLLCGCTMDAIGVCVDDAISALFELTGKRVTNEVTDEIFRRFCVGK